MDLQTLKNNYAQEQGYEDWRELQEFHSRNPREIESHMNEICIRAQKAYGDKIKESVSIFIESDLTVNDIFNAGAYWVINLKSNN